MVFKQKNINEEFSNKYFNSFKGFNEVMLNAGDMNEKPKYTEQEIKDLINRSLKLSRSEEIKEMILKEKSDKEWQDFRESD